MATCGRDRMVRLWSAADGAKGPQFDGHGQDVFSVAFHPDGRSLVSGDFFGGVRHWDLETGECIREFDASVLHAMHRLQDVGGVRSMAFDSAGTKFACAGTEPSNGGNVQGKPTILVFDWITGALKHTLQYGAQGDGYIFDMHFHPDGFLMAVSSGNPGTGKLIYFRPGDKEPFLYGD